MPEDRPTADPAMVAQRLAAGLNQRGQEYAFGGALALGYWAAPRGTLDVDLTLFLPLDKPSECIWLLEDLGCELSASEALASLREHGFCRAAWQGVRVDVFLPLIPFYETARQRRKRMDLGGQPIAVWDAESLAVFKMLFFRRKDLADVEQILRSQGARLDRAWVREQLESICGSLDPRLSQWDELVREVLPGD